MSVALPVLNGVNLRINPNPVANEPIMEHVQEYTSGTSGAYRLLSIVSKALLFIAEAFRLAGAAVGTWVTSFAGKLATASYFLSPFRLPEFYNRVKDIVTDWNTNNSTRDRTEQATTLLDAVATVGYTVALVNPIGASVAGIFSLGKDSCELAGAAQDVHYASEAIAQNSGNSEAVKALEGTRMCSIWKIVKTAAAIISAVGGLLALVLGASMLPAIVLLGFGIISGVAAILGHFQNETNPYKAVKFGEQGRVAIAG